MYLREHDEIGPAFDRRQQLGLGLRLGVLGHRDVVVGERETLDLALEVGVVGDDHHDLPLELAAPPAPQQVVEAVVIPGDHHHDALALDGVPDAPGHAKGLGDGESEALAQPAATLRRERELDAHEEDPTLRVGRVLVRAHDVGPVVEQELRDGGHYPRAVGAGNKQPHRAWRTVVRRIRGGGAQTRASASAPTPVSRSRYER